MRRRESPREKNEHEVSRPESNATRAEDMSDEKELLVLLSGSEMAGLER